MPARPKLTHGSANKRQLELLLAALFGRESVVAEHRFHQARRWRFDYAVPHLRLAVEYQGHGQMAGTARHVGGHASVSGLANDCEKLNAAAAAGWRVIKLTALHFRAADRAKHKLTSPHDTLAAFLTP